MVIINLEKTYIGWNVLGAKPGFNICSGTKIFGGYGFFGKGAVANKLF